MRILIVTEKCGPDAHERDGGSRLVTTLQRILGTATEIAQFGATCDRAATWHFPYPVTPGDRFARRLSNARFIADRVRQLAGDFTHVAFVHISMQFGFADEPLEGPDIWTFPMFLTPFYQVSGEVVPAEYTERERASLHQATVILSPSHLERRILLEDYGVDPKRVRVVPRGVDLPEGSARPRKKEGPLVVASVGSVKPQKDVLGLLRAFATIRARHPDATLHIAGGAQDRSYEARVVEERERLGLADAVHFRGYIAPGSLPAMLAEAHIHLSASRCETFGRAIFETLAMGLPNVALAPWNAASEYLNDTPCAKFVASAEHIADAVDGLLENLPRHSAMAQKVGAMFDERILSQLLLAELRRDAVLAISDWDGTLFHKEDELRTRRSIEAFRRFPRRVICTARSVSDALAALREHELEVDWIVGHSGAVIADGRGTTLDRQPLRTEQIQALLAEAADALLLSHEGEVIQVSTSAEMAEMPPDCRAERYQGTTFISHQDGTKLRGVLRLLRHLETWGRVRAFGDGVNDEEVLRYFDGVLVRSKRRATTLIRIEEEVSDDD